MVRTQRVRRPAGGKAVARKDQTHRPCSRIIVRLRPVLQDELASGESQSAVTTTHRGEVKLKPEPATQRRHIASTRRGVGDGKRQSQQHQREDLLPRVFQVDNVLGPDVDTSEVFSAAASRLVDRAMTGGKALLLVAGTPGSGRSHTLWGALPQQHDSSGTPLASAAPGIDKQGLIPLALADLSHRWNCGNGSPFYHSSSAAAAAATAGPRRFPSSSTTSAERHSSLPFAPPLAFRLCVAEVLPGGGRETSNNEARTKTSQTARDLLRFHSSASRPSTGGGDGDVGENRSLTPSPSPPRRWALSARDALAGLASSSSASPRRSSLDRNDRRRSGGGGPKSRAWMGMGRGRSGAAAEGSLLASRVLAGVDEVSADGIEEALALVGEGLRKRRGEGHLVVSAKLVTAGDNDTRVGPTPEGLTETGELVFIELGDCPKGGLPQTLRKALSHLKIGRDHVESLGSQTSIASRSAFVAVTGTTGASPSRAKQRSGDDDNGPPADSPSSNDPLWALLSAFAEPGPNGVNTLAESAAKGAASAAATAAAAVTGTAAGEGREPAGSRLPSRHPAGKGTATAATAGDVGTGAVWKGAEAPTSASAATTDDCPLVVSVVATLRSGDARYLEEKALLEALAKSSRTRPDSWRSRPLGRMLVSMPSFSWWSSHPGPASAAAAAAVAAADGSAPVPAPAAAPSAPPVPSSEEVSLAMSNYSSSSSRSGSSSLSYGNGEEAASAATAAIAACNAAGGGGGASVGLSACANVDGSGSPTPPRKAVSVSADAIGTVMTEGSAAPGGGGSGGGGCGGRGHGHGGSPREATSPTHFEEASSNRDTSNLAGVLVTGGQGMSPRSQGGRRPGDGDGRVAGLTIEEADEAADEGNVGGARTSKEKERRVSPPWDDSTLGLLGLTQDELIGRVLKAEKQSRHWKSQHARVERKLTALLAAAAATESQQRAGNGEGGVGAARAPPTVGSTADLPGSASRSTAGRSPENFQGCSPGPSAEEEENTGEGDEALTASPCELSSGTAPDTTDALSEAHGSQAREHHGGDEGEGSSGSCGGSGEGEESNGSTSVSPGASAVERASRKEPPSSGGVVGGGGGVQTMPNHEEKVADHLPPRSKTVAANNNSENGDTNDNQPLTFKERRAVFSSNNSIPVTPAFASLPWSVAANATAKAANPNPPSPRSSPPRAGTRTSPPSFTAFSAAAVEAARQNLKRTKLLPAKRDSTAAAMRSREAVAPGHLSFRDREHEGEGSRVASDSRSSPPPAAVSVSPGPLSEDSSSSAAYSSSPAPCTPSRQLHHRRTSAPSPPAPSPCSTADQYRTTPRSPGSSASGARSGGKWSSSFSSPPGPPSPTASSPQIASPPSFPKPNAERRRARARSARKENWTPLTTASSSSMASSLLVSSATAETAAAAPLPPTAPAPMPRGSANSPESAAAAATTSGPAALSSGSPVSPFAWSGTALKRKSVRLQHSPASASFSSAVSPLPSSLPQQGDIGAASAVSRVAAKGQGVTGIYHGTGGGGSGGGGTTTEAGFPISNGLSAFPRGEAAFSRTSYRSGGSGDSGGGGGGGRFGDEWKERPAGVGPWPLSEQTREGRASLEERQGVIKGGAIGTGTGTGTGTGSSGHLSGGRGVETAEAPGAATTEKAADAEVSIGNISTIQASRLRALREKMERRYSLGQGAVSETAATATIDTSATVPEGPKSLDRPVCRGRSQALEGTPWASRQEAGATWARGGAVGEQENRTRPLRNINERM